MPVTLDPAILGWTEFWLRIGVLAGLVAAGLLALLVAVKLLETLLLGIARLRGRR